MSLFDERKEVIHVAEQSEQFLWSQYSADPRDRGVEVRIPFKGKIIPVRIRMSLSLDERQRASEAAIQLDFDEQGKPKLIKQDQSAYTKEIVLMGLKYWPFEYSPGNPVPINRKSIDEADGGLLSEIAARILGTTEVKKEDLGPFEKASDEASSKVERPNRS